MLPRRTGVTVLFAVVVLLFVSFLFIPRIPQPPGYHNFADHRAWLGIPNFANVASNLPFAIFGGTGLLFLRTVETKQKFIDARERWPYVFVFLGLFLTAFGSGYYHWHPFNATLLWDRLPMTSAFMGIVAALVSERVSVAVGHYALVPLLLLGVSSPIQWYLSELRDRGDLRFYAAVQLAAVLALPLFLLLFPARYTRGADLWVIVVFYVLAKCLETFDEQIFAASHIVSGHTLKHIVASLSGYWIYRMLRLRRPMPVA